MSEIPGYNFYQVLRRTIAGYHYAGAKLRAAAWGMVAWLGLGLATWVLSRHTTLPGLWSRVPWVVMTIIAGLFIQRVFHYLAWRRVWDYSGQPFRSAAVALVALPVNEAVEDHHSHLLAEMESQGLHFEDATQWVTSCAFANMMVTEVENTEDRPCCPICGAGMVQDPRPIEDVVVSEDNPGYWCQEHGTWYSREAVIDILDDNFPSSDDEETQVDQPSLVTPGDTPVPSSSPTATEQTAFPTLLAADL